MFKTVLNVIQIYVTSRKVISAIFSYFGQNVQT